MAPLLLPGQKKAAGAIKKRARGAPEGVSGTLRRQGGCQGTLRFHPYTFYMYTLCMRMCVYDDFSQSASAAAGLRVLALCIG
jgi:hypothetical protein